VIIQDGVTLYGESDVTELKIVWEKQCVENVTARVEGQIQDSLITVFKREIGHGNMSKDYAVELYNKIADENRWTHVSQIAVTYNVTVTLFGDSILFVENIEANDEDDACDKVTEDLDFSDIEVNFTVSALGEDASATVTDDSYYVDFSGILRDNIEVSAEENED
jgi:hypothetical protein